MKIGTVDWARPFASVLRVLAFTLAICATSQAWAEAPVPVVVWDGAADNEYNFSSLSKTVGGVTYAIHNIDEEATDNSTANIRAADNSYLQVVNQNWGYKAPTITASGSDAAFGSTSGSTVLIKYDNMPGDTYKAANRAVLGFLSKDAQTYGKLHIGVLKYKNSTSSVYSFKNGSESGNGSLGGDAFIAGQHTLALTYKSDAALKCYTDGTLHYTWNTPDTTFTTPDGICMGGVDYTDNANRFYAMVGMKICGVAIFDSALSAEEIAAFVWPSAEKYQKWSYAGSGNVLTWVTPYSEVKDAIANASAKYKVFSINSGLDTSTSYEDGTNTSSLAYWPYFCYTTKSGVDSQYSRPGRILRFVANNGYRVDYIHGTFSPLTLGGLIVEEGAIGYKIRAYSSGNAADANSRAMALGDPNGEVETWFDINEDFTIARTSTNALMGTLNVSVAANKSFTLSKLSTIAKQWTANGAGAGYPNLVTPGGGLRMYGSGNLVVSEGLVASGALLDYSNLALSRLATPGTYSFIQGPLTIDGSTSFAFPAGMAKNTKYALCSGTLTNSGESLRTATITVGEDTFDAILTFDTSDATVSYVPIYEATIDEDTVFSGITWTPALDSATGCKIKIHGSGKVTGLSAAPASIEIDSGVTLDVTAIESEIASGSTTLSGEGAFLYTSSYPTSVPVGITYEYVGSNTEGSPTAIDSLTVNGKLKTSGYISLTTFSLPAGGSLDVLDGSTRVAGTSRALKGDVTVRDNATLVYASNDLLDYDGSTHADIYGTLEIDGSSNRFLNQSATMILNFYGGSTIKGSGFVNLANDKGFNVKANPDDATKDTVYFQTNLKYNSKSSTSTIAVDDGVTLELSSGSVYVHNGNTAGSITKAGGGKVVLGSSFTASSFVSTLNVSAGEAEIADAFGGAVVVASGAMLTASGSSPSIAKTLTLADGATLKIDGSASLTITQAVTLPTGEGESVTLDLTDFTKPTGTTSPTILTASATLDLDVGRFEFEGASSDYYLTQNTTSGAVTIRLHVSKGSDNVYRDDLTTAFSEIVADHDLEITVLNGTGADNAESAKSYLIAWDSTNNRFLYGYAKIGTEPYISLAAAIEASTTGDTITLLRNTAENVSIKHGTTLSLNGFTVDSVRAEDGYVLVPDDAEDPTSYSTVEAKVSAVIGGNTRYFETLSDALTAADGVGTITLLDDCSANANLAAGVTLIPDGHDYTGELSGSGTIMLSNLTAPNIASTWSGTVVLPANQSFAGLVFDDYGRSGSTVRLQGTNTGRLKYKTNNDPIATTVEIPDGASLTITGWSPSFANAFDVLKGAGTFAVSIDSAPDTSGGASFTAYFLLKDVSSFTGSLSASGAGIAIGDTRIANTVAGGKIIVSSGKSATIAEGATWQTSSGFSVDGALTCDGGIMYGTEAAGTLALGGSGVITNKFEGGSAQCFNAGAITVSDSLSVVLVGGWSSFGTWTLTETASLGFDPGTDNDIWLNSTIEAAQKTSTIHIYGNGSNTVVENNADGTKLAAIHVHNGGRFQVSTAAADNDRLKWEAPGDVGGITVDAGGEMILKSRESYTRNTTLNGGTITLDGVQSDRSIDIFKGPTFTVNDDSMIVATGTNHWIYLRNTDPTFNVAANKTLTVNAGFKYDGTNSKQNLIKSGAGTLVVNGYTSDGVHESFSQPKGVNIQAGTYELNAVQTSNGQTGDGANFYTVASGAKLKVGATGQVNTTTLNLTDGSIIEFGSGNTTQITTSSITGLTSSGDAATISFSQGVTPTSGTRLIACASMPQANRFALAGSLSDTYLLTKDSSGLLITEAFGSVTTTSGTTLCADMDAIILNVNDAMYSGTFQYITILAGGDVVLPKFAQSMPIKNVGGANISIDVTAEFSVATTVEGDITTYTVSNRPTVYTWTDAADNPDYSENHDWTKSGNWSYGNSQRATRYPQAGDTVIIGNGSTIVLDESATIYALTVSGTVTLTASTAKTLTVTNGGIVMPDRATSIAVDNVTLDPAPTTSVGGGAKVIKVGDTYKVVYGTIFSVY